MARGTKKKYTSEQKVRRTTLRRATKSAALAAKKLSTAHGRNVSKSDNGGGRKGGEVADKSGANRVRAKVGEKAAGNKSLRIAKSIHRQL